MRQAFIWLFVLVLCASGIQDISRPDALTLLAREIPHWVHHDQLGPAIQDVQQRLKIYVRDRRQAEIMVDKDSLRLDIVGQTHMPPNIIPIGRSQILTSQRNVYTLLTRLKPEVVGVEGWHNDTLTAKAVLGQIRGNTRRKILAELGAIKYLDRHRTIPAFGVEDSSLQLLMLKIMDLDLDYDIEDVGPEKYDALDRLYQLMLNARSQLAVDRTIIGLHRFQRHHAALVIGSSHRSGCLNEATRLGIDVRYYHANTYILLKK